MAEEKSRLDFGLLANFTHQVINPLNGVSGTIDNLIDGTIKEPRRIQRLKAARAQLEHSVMLVRNLAYFSQISLDPTNSNPGNVQEECRVPKLIIQASMFYQELAVSKQMTIDLKDRNTQYVVRGNPDLLRQVFMNLFDNAVKYGERHTEVAIDTWAQKHSGALLVKVTGKSPFIPVADRSAIFSLGFRGGSAKARVASGTGLGLYICRTIVEEVYKGAIEVESSAGKGENSFLIRFPSYTIAPEGS